jgi:hypothetical protein
VTKYDSVAFGQCLVGLMVGLMVGLPPSKPVVDHFIIVWGLSHLALQNPEPDATSSWFLD